MDMDKIFLSCRNFSWSKCFYVLKGDVRTFKRLTPFLCIMLDQTKNFELIRGLTYGSLLIDFELYMCWFWWVWLILDFGKNAEELTSRFMISLSYSHIAEYYLNNLNGYSITVTVSSENIVAIPIWVSISSWIKSKTSKKRNANIELIFILKVFYQCIGVESWCLGMNVF